MGIYDLFTTVQESVEYARILIYGKEGSMKTHLSSSFPKPLILDFDGGAATAKKVNPSAPLLSMTAAMIHEGKVEPYKQLSQLFSDAIHRKGEFAPGKRFADRKTLVIDGWTGLAEMLIREMVNEPGEVVDLVEKMQQGEWGQLLMMQESLMAKIKCIPMTVVITCWLEFRPVRSETIMAGDAREQQKQKAMDENLYMPVPNVPGSYRDKIRFAVNEVYYVTRDVRTGKRYLHSKPYKKYTAKSKAEGDMPSPLEIPENVNPVKLMYPYLSKYYEMGLEKKPTVEEQNA